MPESENMEREARLREYQLIGGGALAGALLLSILTLVFWKVFDLDHATRIDFGILAFTLPKGAMLGGATGYVITLVQTQRSELAAKVCLVAGVVVMLVFGAGLDNIRTSLQWDGFTALWGLGLLSFGGPSFYKHYKQRMAEEAEDKLKGKK